MKKIIVFLFSALLVLPATAFEIELSASIAPPSVYIEIDKTYGNEVSALFPDMNLFRVDLNYEFPNDIFIDAQFSLGFPKFYRSGIGVGKDFKISDSRSIRLTESLVFGFLVENSLVESLTEVMWHPYKSKGFFVGGGISASIMILDLLWYGRPVFFLSVPIKAGYTFTF